MQRAIGHKYSSSQEMADSAQQNLATVREVEQKASIDMDANCAEFCGATRCWQSCWTVLLEPVHEVKDFGSGKAMWRTKITHALTHS